MDGDIGAGIGHVYMTEHIHSRVVSAAFAEGSRWAVVPPAELKPGAGAFYGILRGTGALLKKAIALGRDWVYIDNGYMKPGHYDGFFRCTRNAYQHDGASGQPDWQRLQHLGVTIAPWRHGRHVLICPPGAVFMQHLGLSADDWLQQTIAALRKVTDRPLRARSKPMKDPHLRPLAADLEDCHALVTYNSNTAVTALLAGVPIFADGPCAARSMGCPDVALIETPRYPDSRRIWAARLAANQWTLAEMRAGLAARALFG